MYADSGSSGSEDEEDDDDSNEEGRSASKTSKRGLAVHLAAVQPKYALSAFVKRIYTKIYQHAE